MTSRIAGITGLLLLLLIPTFAHGASTARVVVYVTYSACSVCPTDPLRERYERYVSEAWAAFREMGIQVRTIDLEPQLQGDLAELYQGFGVPDDMRAMYTLAVSIDDRFLFINHVPVKIMADFVANHSGNYRRIIVFRDEAQDMYRIVDDKGDIMECKIVNSIVECLPFSSNPSTRWSFLSLVVVSGLLDGINPCAFAVLLFLVTLLFAARATTWEHPQKVRRMVLLFGSTYLVAVYLTYLAIGLTLRQAIAFIPFPHMVSKLGALVVLGAGVLKAKDHFRPGRGVTLKLSPQRWQKAREWMRKGTLPATFVTGALVALFEFPCTGAIYLAILSMLATRTAFAESLPYLLIYNLAFILPLAALLFLASRRELMGFSIRRWQQGKGRSMELIEASVYMVLGAFLLLSGFA